MSRFMIPEIPTPGNAQCVRRKPTMTIEEQKLLWPDANVMTRGPQRGVTARYSGSPGFICENCGSNSHSLATCIGPVDQDFCLYGCPIHGTWQHCYDECWHPLAFTEESRRLYLILRRNDKPPIYTTRYSESQLIFEGVGPLTRQEVRDTIEERKAWHIHDYGIEKEKSVARRRVQRGAGGIPHMPATDDEEERTSPVSGSPNRPNRPNRNANTWRRRKRAEPVLLDSYRPVPRPGRSRSPAYSRPERDLQLPSAQGFDRRADIDESRYRSRSNGRRGNFDESGYRGRSGDRRGNFDQSRSFDLFDPATIDSVNRRSSYNSTPEERGFRNESDGVQSGRADRRVDSYIERSDWRDRGPQSERGRDDRNLGNPRSSLRSNYNSSTNDPRSPRPLNRGHERSRSPGRDGRAFDEANATHRSDRYQDNNPRDPGQDRRTFDEANARYRPHSRYQEDSRAESRASENPPLISGFHVQPTSSGRPDPAIKEEVPEKKARNARGGRF